MSDKNELVRWIRNQVFKDRITPLAKFVLRNAAYGSRGGEVEEFDVAGEMTPEQVSAFAEQIVQSAKRDADAAGTKLQSYLLMALEEDASTGPRFRFRIRGEGDEEDSGEERPDKDGIVSQMMRHNEALMRMATMGASSTIMQLTKQLEAANAVIAKQNEQRQAMLEVVEEARTAQHDREMQAFIVNSNEERKTKAFDTVAEKVGALWPVVINKLSGKQLLSEGETNVLQGFVNGLSQQQLAQIASCLSTEQRIALMKIYQEVQSKKPAASDGAVD